MNRTFAVCWAMVATFTLYINNASGQGKAEEKKAAATEKKEDKKEDKKETKEAQKAEKKDEKKNEKPAGGPPTAGPETKALQFMAGTMNGTGKLEAGAYGPGSPEMATRAKQTCKWILNNLWMACDISDTAGTGKQAQTWMGHMLAGWDFEAKAYRIVGVDSMGGSFDMNGKMDGKKFIMESARETVMMGQPVKFRFTYDTTDPKAIKFTDERSMKGGPWELAETVTFKKGG